MKAYIISESENGMEDIDGVYYLVTEEGELLAYHWCSNKHYAMGDLYGNRPDRIKEWSERFGEFAVDYLGCDDMTKEKTVELNHNKRLQEHER